MSSHLRHRGSRRTARNLRNTMLASGVVLFTLGLYFFATVTCVEVPSANVTWCGIGDQNSWHDPPTLGFMSWLRLVLLAGGGLLAVSGWTLRAKDKRRRNR